MNKTNKIVMIVSISLMLLLANVSNQVKAENIPEDTLIQLIKDILKKNPEIIIDAINNYNEKQQNSLLNQLVSEEDASLKPDLAKVQIVEFFDYNCGFCKKQLDVIVNEVNNNDDANLYFKELPILSQDSEDAAIVALAVKKQGMYVPFHIKLMSYRGRVTQQVALDIAKEMKLDIEKLLIDMKDPSILKTISKNRALAKRLNISGTPAIVSSSGTISGGYLDATNIKLFINEAIKIHNES